ncbi:prolyl oligopeptidase [Neisseria sp. HSC-16F19]|nr:prolyl oligopeptidase family serine peptidase [Neisseria sp. HSC-16F19]MCP2039498.1 prolyl oligopeptidase [Neisseria sp. HSC-16F19]
MTISDPYLHLENLDDPATREFAAVAHERMRAHVHNHPGFQALCDDITAVLQDENQIPFCQEHRAQMYHFHQSADEPKGVYRVCSAASYRAGLPEWRVLFQVAAFDEVLGDNVSLAGVSHCVTAPHKALLTLSADGADAAYTLEFDLAEQKLVDGGFHFPLGNNHIAWRDEDSVWVCPAWDERQLTRAGYPRQVWLLRRGQSMEEALPVFEADEDDMMVHAWRYLDGQGAPIDLLEAAHGFYRKQYYQIAADGSTRPIGLPETAEIAGYLGGQLLVQLRHDWQRAKQRYTAGSLLAVKLNKGELGEAQALFVPQPGQALDAVETSKRFAMAHVLDQAAGRLYAWRFDGGRWQAEPVPDFPGGALEITDQPWGGDVVYVAASGFTTPLTLYALDLQQMELSVMRRQRPQFDAEGIEVRRLSALSADGTAIPYYHVGRRHDAATPTLVYVYGGFGVPELPHYLGNIGRHWLQHGYAFVLANVRGGGEFGPAWHHAAQGVHKHRSVDDLLAVVADLHQRGLSSLAHTAIQGGSNGGLVTAAAYCRAPDIVGALVCEVPLTDMLRYPYLSAGASWLEEFGDPADPQHHAALAALSPYHNIRADGCYPPALISTHLGDDRVHPAHALKFYARLKEAGAPVWLAAPASGGHGGGTTQAETAQELATVLAFLYQTVAA